MIGRFNLPKSSKNILIWKVAGAALVFLFVLKLVLINLLAIKGGELAKIERETREISRKNQFLKEEIAANTSLSRIASESEKFGLARPAEVIYVNLQQPPALSANFGDGIISQ